jgi:hypothetical protein
VIQKPRDIFVSSFVGFVGIMAFLVGIGMTTLAGLGAASVFQTMLEGRVSPEASNWIERIAFVIVFVIGFYLTVVLSIRAYRRLGRELST